MDMARLGNDLLQCNMFRCLTLQPEELLRLTCEHCTVDSECELRPDGALLTLAGQAQTEHAIYDETRVRVYGVGRYMHVSLLPLCSEQ